jgi:drug/metabolite transporter (DMT)-like permease
MYLAHFLPFLKVQLILCAILPSTSITINSSTGKLESKRRLRCFVWVYVTRNMICLCCMLILRNRWCKLDKWEQIFEYTCLLAGLWGTCIRISFIWNLSQYLNTVNGIIGFETNELRNGKY